MQLQATIKEILNYRIRDAEQGCVFIPRLIHTGKEPWIKWSSWGAGCWLRQKVGKSSKLHLGLIKQKLEKGKPARKIEIVRW